MTDKADYCTAVGDGWYQVNGKKTQIKTIQAGTPGLFAGPHCNILATYKVILLPQMQVVFENNQPQQFSIPQLPAQGAKFGSYYARKGETRQQKMPPEEGWGAQGNNHEKIPPNATFIYEVTYHDIAPGIPEEVTQTKTTEVIYADVC